MSFTGETLYNLLPAIYRIRDAELGAAMPDWLTPDELSELHAIEGQATPTAEQQSRLAYLRWKQSRPKEPLKSLLMAFGDEIAVLEENLAQLYDDLFIETCADWVVPYIGDLIGFQPLHNLGATQTTARAEVAHTIALRRRKGTAAVLEQLAYDVTGWRARVVEYFQRLGVSQYMNHLRPHCHYSVDLRQGEQLAMITTPFSSATHTIDVRNIENRSGRYNIGNIGLHLWRLNAYPHTCSPAVPLGDGRYLISPLGQAMQLYNLPQTEKEITHLAEPVNVPMALSRRIMASRLRTFYGWRERSGDPVDNGAPGVVLYADGQEIPRVDITVCNLEDDGPAWGHEPPPGKYAVDPELGRVAVAADLPVPQVLQVTYHYGFSADLGGGEYGRERIDDPQGTVIAGVPGKYPTITAALKALKGGGIVEISGSGRYEENLSVEVNAGENITLRADLKSRPTLVLSADIQIDGGEDSGFRLEGILVSGGCLRVGKTAHLARLHICHATIVPGLGLEPDGAPQMPGAPGLVVERDNVSVTIDHAIVGSLYINSGSTVVASNSIIDAASPDVTAYAGADGSEHGGQLSLVNCTAIGRIRARAFGTVANSILLAEPADGDPLPAVHVTRRQIGCVRFSWLPADSVVPRRYRCLPGESEERLVIPQFSSLRYGNAAYCQLARSTPEGIRRGGDDEGEMGVYHDLFPAQREANLRIRLQEFLRAGLRAGIFYES